MDSDFNPLVAETFDSPQAEYARLRAECPVAHSDAWGGFWALMKYDDVVRAATETETFITSVQNVIPKVAFTGRRPPLHLDPPEHTPYRRALAPLFTEKRIAALRPHVERVARDLLAPLVEQGHCDVVEDFSAPLPVAVFARWMNLEAVAADELTQIGKRYNIAVQSNDEVNTREASLKLYEMARAIVAERTANPLPIEDDPTSALLAARADGEGLPHELIIGTIRQVLVVGIIAPSVTVGSMVVHLTRDRALQARLRADPGLIPAAVAEFLRLYTPYRGFARTAVCPVSFRGREIDPGEPIALVYASANRDEEVFEAPDEFRIDRPNMQQSVAFGRGPHMCIGASLARLELTVVLEQLLAAAPGFALAGAIKPTRFPEIGALSVPITFERA